MDLSSVNASPVLADPVPMNQTILGFHSSVFSLSSGTSFPLLIPKKKPGKLDDVQSNGWLDAMQSSSPPRKKMLKDVGVELACDDSDLVYYSWMLKYPSALKSFNRIINRANKRKIVIFLDYDGTLSPIVDDPNRAFMSIDMRAAVKGVAKYFPTAIISGRSRDKVYELVGLTELFYAGSHGMDIMFPAEDTMSINHTDYIRSTDKQGKDVNLFQPAKDFIPMIDEVYRTLVEVTKDIPGAFIENHKFCTSVHYRNVHDKSWPMIAQCVHDVLKDYPRLRLTHGRKVLEVRPVIDWDKGKAVEFLLESLGGRTELDALSHYSEVVPDTVVFDDFERFPPTAATVSPALLLGICSLPDTTFKGAVDTALADKECYGLETPDARMTCFVNKALVNVGGELSKLVPGRVSTEVDARLAYDTHAIVGKVENLLRLYNSIDVPAERLLFKIPSTWQGIEAARLLESEGIQTHMTFVYSFSQAAAAAQAGASVIQIFVGRLRDWSRNHSGDPEIEAALKRGEDPGLALVTKAYNYIHKYGHKTKLMVASIRNKQDVFNVLGVDYIITPLKILQALKESVTPDDDKYTFVRRLSSESAAAYNFTDEELVKWDQRSFASAMGPAALELLATGMDGYSNQAKRLEELFGKIWPPPNV